ncbi:hypothetical protein UPYG_G00164510 [Umbra pygmaea]|uniref:MADS-box domain-containing protein n=1 Tax=Umbra pygmaea TaxID=75934 RepID=A0ABD0WN53_UMBPY
MGRKKIQISRITDERNRQVTFMKRKFGLMKKAYELSVLCDCEIALIIFNSSNKLFQYASTDMDKVLLKYTEYNEPHESRTNSDIVEDSHSAAVQKVLHKKEQRGCESPDADVSYVLTPHTEEKYKQINEEFDIMMRNHKITTQQKTVSNNSSTISSLSSFIPGGLSSQGSPSQTHRSLQTKGPGLSERSLQAKGPELSSSQHHRRNLQQLSPLSQQRPATPGNAGSGLLASSSSAACSGKLLPSTCPLATGVSSEPVVRNKTDLTVVVSPSCKGMMLSLRNSTCQSSQSLSTPVVSVTSPSLGPQSLMFPGIGSAYNSEYSISSPDLGSLQVFTTPSGVSLGNTSTWQQFQLGQLMAGYQDNQGNPGNKNHVNKSEPSSPPSNHRIATTLCPAALHHSSPTNRPVVQRSPANSISSSCSYEEDQEAEQPDFYSSSSNVRLASGLGRSQGATEDKRMRMDS